MLGTSEPLDWAIDELDTVVIKLPQSLQEPASRPCQQAFAFKLKGDARNTTPAPRVAFLSGGWLDAEAVATLTPATSAIRIYYTLNGSLPTKQSPVYEGPLRLRRGQVLRACGIQPGLAVSDEVQLSLGRLRINFQPAGTPIPEGFVADVGATFGASTNGATYGWSSDNSSQTRQRAQGKINDTFCHFLRQQKWELAVPAGRYWVRLTVGDAAFASANTINVEGVAFCRDLQLSSGTQELTDEVEVLDGRLTVDCGDSPERMSKIAAIDIAAR